MHRRFRGVIRGAVLVAPVAAAGCGWILGLDEFTDRPPPGKCEYVEDCPGGVHGLATCEGGVCGFACEQGFDDCDGALGCETATTADRANCGGCGVTCNAFCVEGSCNDPVDIAAGGSHACAILKDGSLWCWGAVPGPGTEVEIRAQPTHVPLPGPALQVAMDGYMNEMNGYHAHTCVLLADRTVRCWGRNDYGQLGVGDTEFRESPEDVGLADIRQISVGGYHTCAINDDDVAFCWGGNAFGQVGDDTADNKSDPAEILDSVAQLATGFGHTCAVRLDKSLYCWGYNLWGQIGQGDGSPITIHSPAVVSSSPYHTEVRCGSAHTCARVSYGVLCWGSNQEGKLGIGSEIDQNLPRSLELAIPEALTLGNNHTGALINGSVYMWGDNAYRQLGTDLAFDMLSPTPIGLDGINKLDLGSDFSCALTDAGVVLCWGRHEHGQLGDAMIGDGASPRPVRWP